MLDAYHVAVKVALKDGVTAGLLGMSKQFAVLGKDADKFKEKLAGIQKIAIAGVGLLAGGMFGTHLISKALKPAEEYAHQLNIMNMAGMTHLEIANAVSAAWKTTSTVITSTATGNLKTIMDLRNVFGKTGEAIQYLPELARIQAVLGASSEGSIRQNSDTLVYSLAKALDIRGAVNSASQFNTQAEAMAKVITATQGRVLPQDYQALFKYGRQGVPGLSNQFLYEELPTFMMQMKTGTGSGSQGGFGTSIAQFYKFFVQGIMTKSAMQGLESLGLVDRSAALKTTTVGTQLKHGFHIRGYELAQTDPFLFVQNVLLPAIRKKYGLDLTNNQISLAIADTMRGAPVTSIFAAQQYALKAQQVYRDEGLIKKAENPMTAYQMALSNDPTTVNAAMRAQWQNFKVALTKGLVPIILPLLTDLTKGLNLLATSLRKHPGLAKVLAGGFTALFAAMTSVGALLVGAAAAKGLIAGFQALRVAILPLALPLAEVAAGIALVGAAVYEIHKHWSSIKGFFEKGADSLLVTQGGAPPGGLINQPITLNNITTLDGKTIAKNTTYHQGRMTSSQQPNHGSSHNADMSFQPNMLNTSAFGF